MYRFLEDEDFKRLPQRQRDAFSNLINDRDQAESQGYLYNFGLKLPRPPQESLANNIFLDVLKDFSQDFDLWPGWEQWAGPYAQKCYGESCRRAAWWTAKVLLGILGVIAGILAYGAWRRDFSEFPSWWPVAAGAWITFLAIGFGLFGRDWLRYRGTDWPSTPSAAKSWHFERSGKGPKPWRRPGTQA